VDGLNYSFSGLKTSFLYFIQAETKKNKEFVQENLTDLCASLQQTILDILFIKLEKAVQQEGINEIAIAGGVSANLGLRDRLNSYEKTKGWKVYIPEFQFCTDNAGMIAVAGYYHYLASEFTDLSVYSESRISLF